MNHLVEAAWEVHQFLTGLNLPYAIIGGLAVQHWGEPRVTANVDVSVAVPADATDEFLAKAIVHFHPRTQDAQDFARENRVLLVSASNGCPVDICLAIAGYEDEMMRRSVSRELQPGRAVRICTPEDLVIHKLVAGRPRDLEDAETVIMRQRDRLDADYIRRWLADFANALDQPDLLERFESIWRSAQQA